MRWIAVILPLLFPTIEMMGTVAFPDSSKEKGFNWTWKFGVHHQASPQVNKLYGVIHPEYNSNGGVSISVNRAVIKRANHQLSIGFGITGISNSALVNVPDSLIYGSGNGSQDNYKSRVPYSVPIMELLFSYSARIAKGMKRQLWVQGELTPGWIFPRGNQLSDSAGMGLSILDNHSNIDIRILDSRLSINPKGSVIPGLNFGFRLEKSLAKKAIVSTEVYFRWMPDNIVSGRYVMLFDSPSESRGTFSSQGRIIGVKFGISIGPGIFNSD